MKERKLTKPLIIRLTFLAVTILIYFLVPMRDDMTQLIERESAWWPFSAMSELGLVILSNYRIWVIGYWIVFAAVLLVAEVIFMQWPLKRNKTAKIVSAACFILVFALLIYFSVGTVLWLAPLPPMSFDVWVAIFGQGQPYLMIWWIVSALLLELSIKY